MSWMKTAVQSTDGLMHFHPPGQKGAACCELWRAYEEGRLDYIELMQRLCRRQTRGGLTNVLALVTCPACLASADYRSGAENAEGPRCEEFTTRYFGWPVGCKVTARRWGQWQPGIIHSVQVRGSEVYWGVTSHTWSGPFLPGEVQLPGQERQLGLGF
jgi:hypothetical protein